MMQTENGYTSLCQKYIVICKLKTVTATCLKKYIVLWKRKKVTETCLKNKLYYANWKQ